MHDKPGVRYFSLPAAIEDREKFLTAKITDGWELYGFDIVGGQTYAVMGQGYGS